MEFQLSETHLPTITFKLLTDILANQLATTQIVLSEISRDDEHLTNLKYFYEALYLQSLDKILQQIYERYGALPLDIEGILFPKK